MSKGLKELEAHEAFKDVEKNPHIPEKHRPPRRSLSVFSKTSAVILLALAILMTMLAIAVHQPVVLVVVGLELLMVTLIMLGIRWTPLLGSILGGIILFVFTSATGYPLHHLTHPKDAFGYGINVGVSFLMFMVMLLLFWCATMLVVSGIAAVIQNYFQQERRAPRWFNAALTGAIGVMFGALILGALAQPAPTIIGASANGIPTVHLGVGAFSQSSITITKGSKLILFDDGDYHHNISTGRWINGQPAPEQQTGEPQVHQVDINGAGKSVGIGPFPIAGTYHLYCAIHSGMMLTIIVQ